MAGRIQAKLWEVALDQHGYVTSADARALGINVVELGKLAYRRQLERVGYGVYRFPQLPVDEFDAHMLATLWAGSRGVLSHDTALELYELCDINPDKIHITVPGRYQPRRRGGELYVVHREDLGSEQVRRFENIPIVTAITAIDQGIRSGVPSYLLRQAVQAARTRGLVPREAEADLVRRIEERP
ncbi:MAG: hypothetical protein GEU97_21705 [Actinophytocola sp.]|nr:hypothetical protein [Actinophytocola sp.]